MDFCRFYGLSAPQLVLLGLPIQQYNKLLKPLNNIIDYKILIDLKHELTFLKSTLTNTITVNYLNPKDRKLSTNVKRNQKAIKNNEELSERFKMTLEEIVEAEEYLKTAPKGINPIVYAFNEEHRLGHNEIQIIEYFQKKLKTIDRYINNIEDRVFTEQKVFGKNLTYVTLGSGMDIKIRVNKGLENASNDKIRLNSLYASYKEDIELLKSLIVKRRLDANENEEGELKIPSYISGVERTEFSKILVENSGLRGEKDCNIGLLYDMFMTVKSFDVAYYNAIFQLECTEEEYLDIFNNLDKIGLVGLNFIAPDLFKMFTKSVTFAREVELKINDDSELAESIKLVDRLLATNLKTGDLINE